MVARSEIVAILEEGDVGAARSFWARFPHMPNPKSDWEALVLIHLTRTKAIDVRFKYRAYSHSWLLGEGYPSLLPEELKPKAEQMFPLPATGAVGISVKSQYEQVRREVQGAMENAVWEAEADGKLLDSDFVRERMQIARERAKKQLML